MSNENLDSMTRSELRIATHDFGIGFRDWAEVDRACTECLRRRGLLQTQTNEQHAAAQNGLKAMRARGSWTKLRNAIFGAKEAK